MKVVVSLFSGGLDSILAVKLVERAGFHVIPLFIYTPFYSKKFPGEIRVEFGTFYGEDFAKNIVIHETGEEYLELVKTPRYGYGKNLNPCIDCKIFFLKIARELMKKYGAFFVVTGEVLGQRGMSQRRDAILKIERESGLSGKIIRPLSLAFFPETEAEKKGLINRNDFPSIRGRERKEQINLAKEFGIESFPQPAGGCLLTDPSFSARVKLLLEENLFTMGSIHAIKYGRLILREGVYVVARNNNENERLLAISKKYGIDVFIPDFKGPVTAVLKGSFQMARSLSCKYTRHCKNSI